MELAFEWLGTVLRVMLAGMFALTPGVLVWLVVLGAFPTIRHIVHSSLFQRVRRVRAAGIAAEQSARAIH